MESLKFSGIEEGKTLDLERYLRKVGAASEGLKTDTTKDAIAATVTKDSTKQGPKESEPPNRFKDKFKPSSRIASTLLSPDSPSQGPDLPLSQILDRFLYNTSEKSEIQHLEKTIETA